MKGMITLTEKEIRDRLYEMYKDGHVITHTETGEYNFPYNIRFYFPDDKDINDLKTYLDVCYKKLRMISE